MLLHARSLRENELSAARGIEVIAATRVSATTCQVEVNQLLAYFLLSFNPTHSCLLENVRTVKRSNLQRREGHFERNDAAARRHRREYPPTPQRPSQPPRGGDHRPLPGVRRGRQALLLHPRRIPLPQGARNRRGGRLLLRLPHRCGLAL